MIDYALSHYETKIELINKIEITNKYPYVPKILYRIPVQDLKAGDILSITSAYEVTNDLSYLVMISSNVNISSDSKEAYGDVLDEGRGYNVTPAMHHGSVIHARQIILTKDYPGINYVKTMVIAASLLAPSNLKDYLIVEANYGHLDIIKYSIY